MKFRAPQTRTRTALVLWYSTAFGAVPVKCKAMPVACGFSATWLQHLLLPGGAGPMKAGAVLCAMHSAWLHK